MTDTPALIKRLYALNPDAVLFDDMDCAVIGIAYVGTFGPVAVYSKKKIYDKLTQNGLSAEDTEEYYQGKFVGMWAGEHTPCVYDDLDGDKQ